MTHADLQAALARMDITMDAAEAHGWLVGGLCTRAGYGAQAWLAELADGEVTDPDAELERLPQSTLDVLSSEGFEFAPLVPGDAAPLRERVTALAAWCDGFLYGVGSGAPDPKVAQAGEVGEFLADVADIARVELEPGRAADAGEGDYAELFEFVRTGVQLTFDTFDAVRARAEG
jgi:uncharacterized protein YgfB (UPF0149 family)